MNPLSYTSEEFSKEMFRLFMKGKEQAVHLWQAFMREGVLREDLPSFKNAPKLFSMMKEQISFSPATIVSSWQDEEAFRFVSKTEDGHNIESVILSMKKKKTLCVSSEIGCKRGCRFCQTAKMGFIRDLKASEIVMQLFLAKHFFHSDCKNIVFMGMGEPFDNFDEVVKAVRIFEDPLGFGIGLKNITISTSGHVDGIRKLCSEDVTRVNLAVSFNASNEKTRSFLMPCQKGLLELVEAMKYYNEKTKKEILVSYVLIKGVNDGDNVPFELMGLLKDLNIKINVIPYNAQEKDPFKMPEEEEVDLFLSKLREMGFRTLLRRSKGKKIKGACGQLGQSKGILKENVAG
jgi:23S rRNA (adenine2503-C2)-methyltransferase